jgi:Uma2 family endonuclease
MWLIRLFDQSCSENGWEQSPGNDLVLPPARDIAEPDHLIMKDPEEFSDMESTVPVEHVLLVSEVVSPFSKRADREVKWLSYAKAGIPLYLLVDRFVEPIIITLFSAPGQDGYANTDAIPAGPGGGKLNIPAPFGMTLDAATMPIPMPAGEAT